MHSFTQSTLIGHSWHELHKGGIYWGTAGLIVNTTQEVNFKTRTEHGEYTQRNEVNSQDNAVSTRDSVSNS